MFFAKIYYTSISHPHGNNICLGISQEDVDRQVAEYCRDSWDEFFKNEEVPESDTDVINHYFYSGKQEKEFLDDSSFQEISHEEARSLFVSAFSNEVNEASGEKLRLSPDGPEIDASSITEAALEHGDEEADSEIEDLQCAIRLMWDIMSLEQRVAFVTHPEQLERLRQGGIDPYSPNDVPPAP